MKKISETFEVAMIMQGKDGYRVVVQPELIAMVAAGRVHEHRFEQDQRRAAGGARFATTHAAPGDSFWDVVKAGSDRAGEDLGIDVRYNSSPEPGEQSTLIDNAVAAMDGASERPADRPPHAAHRWKVPRCGRRAPRRSAPSPR